MSKSIKLELTLIGAFLMLSVLSCSAFPESQQIQVTSTQSNDVEPEPNQNMVENPAESADSASLPPGNDEAVETINLDTLEEYEYPFGFDTYRTTFDHSFSTGDGDYGRISGEGVVNHTEPALSFTTFIEETGENTDSDLGVLEPEPLQVRIMNGVVTSKRGEHCNVINTNVGPMEDLEHSIYSFNHTLMPSQFLTGMAALVETDVLVNGRITNHYVLRESNFDPRNDPPIYINSLYRGDLYLDAESSSLVRVVIEGFGTDQTINFHNPGLFGDIRFELNHLDFNEIVEIIALSGCEALPETRFPVIEPVLVFKNNEDDTYIEMIVPLTLQEIADFYRSEMVLDNWSLIEETGYEDNLLILEFGNSNGERVKIDMKETPGPASGGGVPSTVVLISLLPCVNC
jgi:hypothetical protein